MRFGGGINNFAEVTHTGYYYKPSKRGCVMSSEARQFVFFRGLFENVKMTHRLLRNVRKSIKKKLFPPLFSFPLHATATQVEAADVSPLV